MYEALQVFKVIVEQSSMNKAAHVLSLSQPALTRKIQKLEEELDTTLFRRIGKRLELTRIGQLTYEYAIEQERMHREFIKTVVEFKEAGRTNITIGASLTTLQTTLPELIAVIKNEHPEIDLQAITGKTHEIVQYVKEHKVDIAVIASSIEDSYVHCTPLFDDHLVLVMPKPAFVQEQIELTIHDLNRMPMILFSKGTWYRLLIDELFEAYQITPEIRMEIDSFEAILRLLHTLRSGALLPKSYVSRELIANNDLLIFSIEQLKRTKRTTSLIHLDLSLLDLPIRNCVSTISLHYKNKPFQ